MTDKGNEEQGDIQPEITKELVKTWHGVIYVLLASRRLKLVLGLAFLGCGYFGAHAQTERWQGGFYLASASALLLLLVISALERAWSWWWARSPSRPLRILRQTYSFDSIDLALWPLATKLRAPHHGVRKRGDIWDSGWADVRHFRYVDQFFKAAAGATKGRGRLKLDAIDNKTGEAAEQLLLFFDFEGKQVTLQIGDDMPAERRKPMFRRIDQGLRELEGVRPL